MIEQIIANGFAYESQGSVYFDITAFKESMLTASFLGVMWKIYSNLLAN
jgi:Cysteinyl-tRNA synthetase